MDKLQLRTTVLTGFLMLGAAVSAHEPAHAATPSTITSGGKASGKPVFVQNIAPGASDAVKVVDTFSAAIKAVKLADAARLLDPKVLILESGGSERSRDEYLREHAIADAAFLQTAEQQLRYRQAQVVGEIAWVATESTLESRKDGKAVLLLSTETMVLRKTAQGWKIVHIHWSSRPAPKNQETT